MEVEEATKPANGEQVGASSVDHSQDTIQETTEDSKSENQTNNTEAASNGKSPKSSKSPVEQKDEKRKQSPEKESPGQGGPSKRVREGQKWNDRPRKQYDNQNDRPRKRHNNRSDLVSQEESRDPFAIRKQVCIFPMLYNFIYSNNRTSGRVLLLRLQSFDRQILIHKS